MNKYKIGQHITAKVLRGFSLIPRDGVITGYIEAKAFGNVEDYVIDAEVVYVILDTTLGIHIDIDEDEITGVLDE